MPSTQLEREQTCEVLRQTANDCVQRGPGYAQEMVVLREAAGKLDVDDLESQQFLLTCWNDLFRQGELSWGYDVDNPGAPFFHIPRR